MKNDENESSDHANLSRNREGTHEHEGIAWKPSVKHIIEHTISHFSFYGILALAAVCVTHFKGGSVQWQGVFLLYGLSIASLSFQGVRMRRFLVLSASSPGWKNCLIAIASKDYREQRIEGLLSLQSLLRFFVVLLVAVSATIELITDHLSIVRVTIYEALTVLYFIAALTFSIWYAIRKKVGTLELYDPDGKKHLDKWCSIMAYIDVAAVFSLSVSVAPIGSQLHVGYMVPALGLWLAEAKKQRIAIAILIAVILRPFIVELLPNDFVPSNWNSRGNQLWLETAVSIGFWIALCGFLIMLRILREADIEARSHAETESSKARKASAAAEVANAQLSELHNSDMLRQASLEFALKEADEERRKKEDESRRAEEALTKVNYYLNCIDTLSNRAGKLIFAKDRERRFQYANSTLLRILTKKAEDAGMVRDDGSPITANYPLTLDDVIGKTDLDFGIDCRAYLRSDSEALRLGRTKIREFAKLINVNGDELITEIGATEGYFEDFEPSIDRVQRGIWTTKAEITDRGEVVGLAGEAVDGFPHQMEELAKHLNDSLPIFASMKLWDAGIRKSRLVWSNHLHLSKLRTRLLELCPSAMDPATALQTLDSGRGPTDKMLYHDMFEADAVRQNSQKKTDSLLNSDFELWEQYTRDDSEVINIAREVLDAGFQPGEGLEVELTSKLRDWARGAKHLTNYPNHGWVERHRFPGTTDYIWVEVRKWPWFERVRENGKVSLKVKGVLVVFQDVTLSHLRRHIVWRWVKRHLTSASAATSKWLSQATKAMQTEDLNNNISLTPLIDLELQMLRWMKAAIEEPNGEHAWSGLPRSTSEMTRIIEVLKMMQVGCEVRSNITYDDNFWISNDGAEVFAIILVLLINAGQATIRRPGQERGRPLDNNTLPTTFSFSIDEAAEQLVIEVIDKGVGFDQADKWRVVAGLCRGDGLKDGTPELSRHGPLLMPGGGICLLKYLLIRFWSRADGVQHKELPIGAFDISSRGTMQGAHAIVRIPWKAIGGRPQRHP